MKRYIISYALDGTYMVKDTFEGDFDESVLFCGLKREEAELMVDSLNIGVK